MLRDRTVQWVTRVLRDFRERWEMWDSKVPRGLRASPALREIRERLDSPAKPVPTAALDNRVFRDL